MCLKTGDLDFELQGQIWPWLVQNIFLACRPCPLREGDLKSIKWTFTRHTYVPGVSEIIFFHVFPLHQLLI